MKLHKQLHRLAFVLAIAMLCGCASTLTPIESKYVFTQFEQVDQFNLRRMQGWQAIDSQSLIVETSRNSSYLLILRRPMRDLRSANSIEFSSNSGTVHAKFDALVVHTHNVGFGPDPVSMQIGSIYKLKSKDDLQAVKSQILSGQ